LKPGDADVARTRDYILAGKISPGLSKIQKSARRRNLMHKANLLLVRGEVDQAAKYYEQAQGAGMPEASAAIGLAMVGVMKSDAEFTGRALALVDHGAAAPHMLLNISTLSAFIELLQGREPNLNNVIAARRNAGRYDVHNNPLRFLRAALANTGKQTAKTEAIFEAMQYGSSDETAS